MQVTDATGSHLSAIAAIYEEAALGSHVTFDLEGRPDDAWRAMLRDRDDRAGRILLVALDGSEVLGYASSGPHKPRRAYDTTCETSVYVASAGRGRGVGGALYDELLRRLDASPLRLALGGVALPNEASVRLHLSRGFVEVGTFHEAGWKLGRFWDVAWYERMLAVPSLVEEVRGLVAAGASPSEVARAIEVGIAAGAVRLVEGNGSGHGVAVVDPESRRTLGRLEVDGPLSDGDRLMLQWCAEAVRPLCRQ